MKIFILTIFIFSYVNLLYPQNEDRDFNEELRYQNEAINSLKSEIKKLRSKVKTAESRERTTVNRITSIDKEITLTGKLINSLKDEEEKTRSRILQLKNDILKNENELEAVRIRYEKRVMNSYLKGSLTELEKVFSSTTWRQAMYRTYYLKIISDIEKKMAKKVKIISRY